MARKPQKPREGPTDQQKLFVYRYLETKPLNATEAYQDVYGVSREVAASAGARLLRNVRVAAFLAERQKVLIERSETTIEEMDADLACAARFDPKDIMDPETGATLPLHQWPERARLAIAGWEEEAIFDLVPTGEVGPRGGEKKERVQIGVLRKWKLHNKTEAKKLWYQRRGALVEKVEVAEKGDELTDEEYRALALLKHEVRGKKGGGNAA